MSNTKHTPGPWFVTEGPTYAHTSRLKVESAPDAERQFGMVIMERSVQAGLPGAVDRECMANARLIAAAPELLAALKKAEHIIQKLAGWSGNDLSELDSEFGYHAIPEAIRKATQP